MITFSGSVRDYKLKVSIYHTVKPAVLCFSLLSYQEFNGGLILLGHLYVTPGHLDTLQGKVSC